MPNLIDGLDTPFLFAVREIAIPSLTAQLVPIVSYLSRNKASSRPPMQWWRWVHKAGAAVARYHRVTNLRFRIENINARTYSRGG